MYTDNEGDYVEKYMLFELNYFLIIFQHEVMNLLMYGQVDRNRQ